MIKLIVLLVILFVGLLFGHTLMGIEGRVVIALPGTVIEMSLISCAIIIFFAVITFWILEWAVKKIFRTISGSKTWLGAFSRRQRSNAFYESINAMLVNEPALALKNIRKTMGGDFRGTNALIAAELEIQAGNLDQAQAFLIDAADYPKTEAIAIMKQAEIALNQGKGEEAMTLLASVEGKSRQNKSFVQLKLRILAKLQDWPQIKTLATNHKKLLGDDYITWASQWVHGEFAAIASKQGANALKQHWQGLSRQARKDEANQVVYVQLLIDQGLYNDAQAVLVEFAEKHAHSVYWPLFKQLKLANPAPSMRFIESELKKQPNNPELFSVLGNLAYNSGDIQLCLKATRKALDLRHNKDDLKLLAKALESNNDLAGANALYHDLIK